MGRDRISELPDSLVTQILSYLPTKDSVTTSVLSKRWEFFWLNVPVIDLKFNEFPPDDGEEFAIFIENFLKINHKSRMQKFKIKYDEYNVIADRFVKWIGTAVDLGIQHLYVETDMAPCYRDFMPQNIYKSKTLVSLKLVTVGIENPKVVVNLPCLKSMHLEDVWYEDDPLIMEKLISGCPVLEDLTLIRPHDIYNFEVLLFLRIRSKSLKSFRFMFENSIGGTENSVEIDAPRLEYLSFKDNQSDWVLVKNLSSLSKIEIDSKFNAEFGSTLDPEDLTKRNIIRDFLTGISSVRHMIISQPTLEVLYRYSKLGPIPKFDNLLCLEAAFSTSNLQLLPVFLESCPNLKNLILDFSVSAESEQTELSCVPQCLLTNLEGFEIKELVLEETWKKLVRYFLENTVLLKKLILRFKDSLTANQESDIFKEIRTYAKRSRRCQFIIH